MAISDSVTSSTSTDVFGNTYTTAVSNDSLESEDFITLMLTELSLQDPTNTVDSSSMMDTQLQLSALEASTATVEAMESLQSTFEQSALASSASIIGNVIETSDLDDEGYNKQYKVSSVSMNDGTISLSAYEISGYYDVYTFDETDDSSDIVSSSSEDDSITLTNSEGESYTFSTYDKSYEELATEITATDGITASMNQNTSGNYQLVVSITNGSSNLAMNNTDVGYSKDSATAYTGDAETVLYENITKIY